MHCQLVRPGVALDRVTSHGRQLHYHDYEGDCSQLFFSNYQFHFKFDWVGAVNKTWLITERHTHPTLKPIRVNNDVTLLGG